MLSDVETCEKSLLHAFSAGSGGLHRITTTARLPRPSQFRDLRRWCLAPDSQQVEWLNLDRFPRTHCPAGYSETVFVQSQVEGGVKAGPAAGLECFLNLALGQSRMAGYQGAQRVSTVVQRPATATRAYRI